MIKSSGAERCLLQCYVVDRRTGPNSRSGYEHTAVVGGVGVVGMCFVFRYVGWVLQLSIRSVPIRYICVGKKTIFDEKRPICIMIRSYRKHIPIQIRYTIYICVAENIVFVAFQLWWWDTRALPAAAVVAYQWATLRSYQLIVQRDGRG